MYIDIYYPVVDNGLKNSLKWCWFKDANIDIDKPVFFLQFLPPTQADHAKIIILMLQRSLNRVQSLKSI